MPLPAVAVSQTPEERFREFLASRPRPQRYTDQQRELLAHIFARHTHFDTDELLADLQQTKKRVSRATVYRTLSKLVDAGLLRRIDRLRPNAKPGDKPVRTVTFSAVSASDEPKGGDFTIPVPKTYTVKTEAGKKALCQCKHTKTAPLCDGSHCAL